MQKLLPCLLAALAALVAVSGARAERPCGLPDTQPLWVEFAAGSVSFRASVFGRPGIVAATPGASVPRALRARGAHTVYWHMKLQSLVGRPKAPADPAAVPGAAAALVERAAASAGCATPLIGLNELWGAYLPMPWTAENAQYRANVLTLLRSIAERGGRPYLFVSGNTGSPRAPAVGDEAAAWWREVAQYAEIVRQVYFNGPYIARHDPLLGSRRRRLAMRRAVAQLVAIGVPAARVGLQLGFQSGAGKGGREGLEPREAWFEVVKREALAARQVALDEGIGSVWSWGWGTFGPASADPDKEAAACVYLWARDQTLCDGPAAAGPLFDTSLTAGQIRLAAGVQCEVAGGTISSADVAALAAVTGDRRSALNALLGRLLATRAGGPVSEDDLDAAEAGVIARGFLGNADAYASELAARRASRDVARAALADELRRQALRARLAVEEPGGSYASWIAGETVAALRTAVCLRDELPGPAPVELTTYLPFLAVPVGTVTLEPAIGELGYGEQGALVGTVASDRARETITIYARPAGTSDFVPLGTVETRGSDAWTFQVAPSVGTTYVAVSQSAVSDEARIGVRPLVDLRVRRGRAFVRARPARPGVRVSLERWSSARGRWLEVGRATLDAASSARFSWRPRSPQRLRARLAAGDGYLEAYSPEVAGPARRRSRASS